jgi:two-component system phosphate regulon sensor histidine kinase PhoR
LRIQESYDTLIFMMDTVIVHRMLPRMFADTTGQHRYRMADSLNPSRKLSFLVDQYRGQLDSSRRLLDRVFMQMIASDDRLEHYLDSSVLAQHLHAELGRQGVDISDFGFCLTQMTPQNKPRMIYSHQDPEANWQDSVAVRIFTRNPFSGQSTLTVYFPRDYVDMLQGMWGNLVMSLLLLLGVGAAFVYTVRSLQRQKKLSQMKTDFINNMTHELKTPIATIGLAAEALEYSAALQENPALVRYTTMIKQEGQRLHNQVNRVLQAAEHQHKKPLELCSQPLTPLLQQAVDAFALQMEQRNTRFSLELPATELMVQADEVHLTQAVANLLDNALKYSQGVPQISIRLYEQGGQAVITVQDNGMGMDDVVQRRIFEPFYRAQMGNRQDTRGYGLGLSYVKSVIDGHSGAITVHSKPGVGTTFIITLPLEA